jgi:DNA-binding CsgD family transcriptional regulator
MPRLSKPQQIARERISAAAVETLPPEPLVARVTAALLSAIPCDGFRFFGIDPETLLVNRLFGASESDGWARIEWLRDVYLRMNDLPYLELPALMSAGIVAVAFQERQEACWGYHRNVMAPVSEHDHYRLFHETRSPVGGTLLACFPAHGRWLGALQAYRREDHHPFKPTDVEFVRSVAGLIGRALEAALSRERAEIGLGHVGEPPGVLIVDPRGEITISTAAGEEWSARLRDENRHAHAPLPTAVWAAIANVRATHAAAVSLVVPARDGLVRIDASPAGTNGAVAVVLAHERPAPQPVTPLEWPLTRQEREVVGRVLLGKSNSDIAGDLYVAETTIEWHLGNVYDKLGVRGRSDLMARFFQETRLPGLIATQRAAGEDAPPAGAASATRR